MSWRASVRVPPFALSAMMSAMTTVSSYCFADIVGAGWGQLLFRRGERREGRYLL